LLDGNRQEAEIFGTGDHQWPQKITPVDQKLQNGNGSKDQL
jgi:hypothetical protein